MANLSLQQHNTSRYLSEQRNTLHIKILSSYLPNNQLS
jgi:hypothetical protein